MARYSKIILIILLSLVYLNANAKSPPPGTGTSDVPANIMIMLDNSGSMRAQVNSSNALRYPSDIATDSKGNVYILEYSYNRIKKYDSSNNLLKTIGGSGWNCNQWYDAYNFQIYNDQIYIYSRNGPRDIKILDLDGNCVTRSSRYIIPNGSQGIAVTSQFIYIKTSCSQISFYDRNNFRLLGSNSFPTSQLSCSLSMNANNSGTKLVVPNYIDMNQRFQNLN